MLAVVRIPSTVISMILIIIIKIIIVVVVTAIIIKGRIAHITTRTTKPLTRNTWREHCQRPNRIAHRSIPMQIVL